MRIATAYGVLAVLAVSACGAPAAAPVRPSPSGSPSPAASTAPATPLADPPTSPPASPEPEPRPKRYVVPAGRYPTVSALVRTLRSADAVLRDPAAAPAAVEAAGQAQQRAYRQLVVTPGWREPAFAGLPEPMRANARDCVLAGAALRAATAPRPALPNWRIVPARPAAELVRYYRESGRRHGVDWSYLAAINLVETRMGRLRGVSTAGARGPMQFLPSTWAEVGRGDIDDDRDAIDAAARYLVRRGARTDIARGVRGYNPSDHYVRAVLAYARVLRRDASAYRGFYHWQVYYRLASGDVVLLEGYPGR